MGQKPHFKRPARSPQPISVEAGGWVGPESLALLTPPPPLGSDMFTATFYYEKNEHRKCEFRSKHPWTCPIRSELLLRLVLWASIPRPNSLYSLPPLGLS